MTPLEKAEAYLQDIAQIQAKIEALQEEAEKEFNEVEARFLPLIEEQKEWLSSIEKDLIALMRKERAAIFGGEDKVSLPSGFLLRALEEKLKLPKDVLERVEKLGWLEAIRVTKTLVRGVVASWPEERLKAIGAKRSTVEVYKYEVAPCGGSQ